MRVPTNFLGQVDPINALRCGFASLKPISITKTVRLFGLRMKTIEWRFQREEGNADLIKSYPTYVKFLNDSVMQKVTLPQRINPIALSDLLTKESQEAFDKDLALKSTLREAEAETTSARPFLKVIKFLRKRYDDQKAESISGKTGLFAHSNLPFSFFTDLVMAEEIYGGFLDTMQRKTGLYETVWLRKYADNSRLFGMKFQEMKDSLAPLFDVAQQSSFLQKCLTVLVVASNCDSVESLSSLEFVDVDRVDSEQFKQLSSELRSTLDRCASTVLSMEPNAFSQTPSTDLNRAFSEMLVQ